MDPRTFEAGRLIATAPGSRQVLHANPVIGILLAAGAGTRFGGPKLLQPMADGTPVGVAALRNLKTAIPHVIAVVRTGDDELGQVLGAEGAEVVVSEHAWLGMGHSLASAVAATQQTEGWVVALGDMPRIRPHTILRVADELRRTSKIVVPMYNSERGHPVAFPSSLRGALLALTGDAGARAFIQGNAEWVARIAVSDPGIVRDVDTLQDLAAIDTPQS